MTDVSIKSKLKELLNHGVIFGLTSSLQNMLGFILLPILTSYYSTADFGVYSIILLANALAGAIFYFGASSSLGRFYYDEESSDYKKQIISIALFISLAGAAILILGAMLFSSDLSKALFHDSKYSIHLKLSLIAAAFTFLLNIMMLVLRYEKQSVTFMIAVLLGVVVNFSITYVLLTKFNYGILAPIYGSVISSGMSFVVLLLRYFNNVTIKLKKSHIRQILTFGLQASLTSLIFYLLDWVDRLIVKDLLPMSDVGIYSLGYRLGAIMNIVLITPFVMIWSPLRMQYANNQNNTQFVKRVISYFGIAGIIIVFLSMLFGADAMSLFFHNAAYFGAAKVFPIIMLSILVYGFQNIIDFGIYFHKKVHFYVIASALGLIFNIVMNYWLIPHFSYIAAAYVTLATYFFTSTILYVVSERYYHLDIDWTRMVWPFLYMIFTYVVTNYINLQYSIILALKFILLILAAILFYKYWFTKEEKEYLKRLKFSNHQRK